MLCTLLVGLLLLGQLCQSAPALAAVRAGAHSTAGASSSGGHVHSTGGGAGAHGSAAWGMHVHNSGARSTAGYVGPHSSNTLAEASGDLGHSVSTDMALPLIKQDAHVRHAALHHPDVRLESPLSEALQAPDQQGWAAGARKLLQASPPPPPPNSCYRDAEGPEATCPTGQVG